MSMRKSSLRLGVSSLALAAAASLLGPAAMAQTASATSAPPGAAKTAPATIEEVVVTGSSIRGAPPVGSNLISVGQEQIQATPAQSVAQILKSVPQITGATAAGQGAFQSQDPSGSYAPTIHALGGSASTTTLVLVDGHRFALTGLTHALGDPSLVPPNAIERVEVLADGASSVYGSDAVAGVINFITRKRYDGVETAAQAGFGDGYRTRQASVLAGKTWEDGSFLLAYNYSYRSSLASGDRGFTRRDHRLQGGTNMAGFACSPASITTGGLVYASPYAAGSGVANSGVNAFCDFSGVGDLLPREIRHNGMIKIRQEVGDKLTVTADGVYSNRETLNHNGRGSVQATIFGPASGRGSQINPFYVGVAGSTATSETVNFDFNQLLGPGAKAVSAAEDAYIHGNAEYAFNDNWHFQVDGVYGFDNSRSASRGGICSSCVLLALNGTTNGSGNLTTPSVPATGQIVLQNLTPDNAVDVFNLGSANRTSAATLARITDSASNVDGRQTIKDLRAQVTGSLFSLPAGSVKIATGGEIVQYTARATHISSLNAGPSSTGSQRRQFDYPNRTVTSGFAELFIPVIGPDMGIPLVRAFDLNLSGRIDKYDDVGTTTNPKFAANWEVFEGLKLRGNYARSFVAPQLQAIGIAPLGLAGETGFTTAGAEDRIALPISLYPQAAFLPGCAPPATSCLIADPAGVRPGIEVRAGSDLDPQKGKTFSIGGDFAPSYLPGLQLHVTYWNNKVKGGITAPAGTLAGNSPDLTSLFKFYPNGATQAEIAAATAGLPQNGALPQTTYFIYDRRYRNVLNLNVGGVDLDVRYSHSTDYGKFTIGNAVTYLTKFDQQIGSGQTFSILNTSGYNLTFPSIRMTGRANVGWNYGNFAFDAFLNYVGAYRNYGGTTVKPVTRDAVGNPTGGGDKVKSNQTLDVHLNYMIPTDRLKKAEVFVDVANVFDKTPSFFNSSNGYDNYSGSPILRVVTVGVRAAF